MTRNTKEFIVGAAVGSLLGSVAALLVAPKSGKKLRQEISDTYHDLSDKTHDLADRGRNFVHSFNTHSEELAKKAKSAVNGTKKSLRNLISEEEEEDKPAQDFLVGSLIGGVLGAVAGLLLAPKAGEELREDIMETYEEVSDRTHDFANDVRKKGKGFARRTRSKANKWFSVAKEVVDGLTDITDDVHEKGEDILEKAKGFVNNSRIHDVMDWASLGVRLWHGVKAKR